MFPERLYLTLKANIDIIHLIYVPTYITVLTEIRFYDTIASALDALSGIPSKSGRLINIRTKTVTKRVLPDFYLMESVVASMRCEEGERSPAKRTATAKMCIIGIEMEKKPFKKWPLNVRKKCTDTGCDGRTIYTLTSTKD